MRLQAGALVGPNQERMVFTGALHPLSQVDTRSWQLRGDTEKDLCKSGLWPQLHNPQGSVAPASATPGLEGLGLGRASLTLLYQSSVLLSRGPRAPHCLVSLDS